MLLEGWFSVLVISEVAKQLLYGFPEASVVGVNSELAAYELELIRDTVGMVAVAITE